MSINRYNARADANQREVIAELESHGCLVVVTKQPVDLWFCYRGIGCWLEVKTRWGKLTNQQKDFQVACLNHKYPCYVLREGESVPDLLKIITSGWG